MASLKEIRTRVSSVKSTRQITSAMKMVSAAKLRRAHDAIIKMRPYANKLQEILSNLTSSIDRDQEGNTYGTVREVKQALLVVIASNKGLCGAFNSNVAKIAVQLIEDNYRVLNKSGHLDIIVIGKKGSDSIRNKGYKITENHHDILDYLSYDMTMTLANKIMASFATEIYDEVKLIYNQFKNAAVQELTIEQYLPIVPVKSESKGENQFDYILEPSKEYIVKELIPKSLKIQLFKALLDSNASEQGARMTAMHKATDNATELIKQLQLDYNKARQASITKEILEIVGGAEALK
jgi:F-type H+-transporting ATPase subunit gamma